MNYQISRIGNYLKVRNIDNQEDFYGAVEEVFIDRSNVGKEIYKIFSVKDLQDGTLLEIGKLYKEDNSLYTASTFEEFYTVNTRGNVVASIVAPSVYSLDRALITETVVNGGTSQQIVPANSERKGFEFQNQSAGNLMLGIGTNPSANSGFIIAAGGGYNTTNMVSTREIKVWGATTGQRFTFIEY